MRGHYNGFTFQGAINNFKKSFNQHIGLPFMVGLCIFYCIFSPSYYWFIPILLVKGGSKQLWASAQVYIVVNRLRNICLNSKQNLMTKDINFQEVLKGTKFDSSNFNLIPSLKDAIFILIKIGEYSTAQKLLPLLTENISDQQLGLIRQFLTKYQIDPKITVPKDVANFRKDLESFVGDVSDNMLKSDDASFPQKGKLSQKWLNQILNFATSGKNSQPFQVVQKEIIDAAYIDRRISQYEPTYSISQESIQQFYNLFAKKIGFPQNIRGLTNIGNTCYMNSALQCLHKTFELTTSIKQSQISSTAFVKTYMQLMQELSRKEERGFAPREMKKLIGKYNTLFDDSAQHDSGQLLATVLNHLSEDLNKVSIKGTYKVNTTTKLTNDELLQQYIKKDHAKCQSIIQDLFFGRFFTIYRCRDCKNELKLFQKFNVLFLPVPKTTGRLTLTGCMREFMKPDAMQGDNAWWCSKCQKDKDTDKYMSVYQNSPILIICLKRFTQTRKITEYIHFDHEITLQDISSNLNIQHKTYDLYGVINHEGNSLHYGHYYSFCKDGPIWRKYNDSQVREIDESQIVTDAAFVLLYRMREA